MNMSKAEFLDSAADFETQLTNAFREHVDKALRSGALDESTELNYATLKAIAMITAESFFDGKRGSKIYKNLKCFI
jgi:hypothetical protein